MVNKYRKTERNLERAAYARAAVEAYRKATRSDDCDIVGDLLGDLRHFCRQEHAPADALGNGIETFAA